MNPVEISLETEISNEFFDQIKNNVKLYFNFSDIFDKCVNEGYINSLCKLYDEILRREVNFVISSEITRIRG